MHIPRIYISQSLQENTTIELEPDAVHHLVTVMRMKAGRSVILFNGQPYGDGRWGEFEATLAFVSKKSAAVAISRFIERPTESPVEIHLGTCVIKNDRMDWLLQKSVELGVTHIYPLISEFTDVKIPADRLAKKMQHWQHVLINACEQSGRVAVPTLTEPQKIAPWLNTVTADKKCVLHPYFDTPNTDATTEKNATLASVALLVGPEGGLTDNEVALSIEHGFAPMVLGPRILRAETAPLAALALLQSQYGDFS